MKTLRNIMLGIVGIFCVALTTSEELQQYGCSQDDGFYGTCQNLSGEIVEAPRTM